MQLERNKNRYLFHSLIRINECCDPQRTIDAYFRFRSVCYRMEPVELSDSFIDYIKDQPILHPCFRLEDVRHALSHMVFNLGLIPKHYPDIKSTFFYTFKGMPLAIMVTPVQYTDDRMCYAFRALFPEKLPFSLDDVATKPTESTSWYIIPSHLYVKLLEKVEVKDVRQFAELIEKKGLLPVPLEEEEFFDPETDPDFEQVPHREYTWQDVEILLTLEAYGYKAPNFYEFAKFILQGIEPAYLKKLALYGYTHFTLADIQIVWRHEIPLNYLKQLADAGYGRFKAVEYHEIYHSKVSPNAVLALYEQGFDSLSCKELIQMAHSSFSRLLPMRALSPKRKLGALKLAFR